MPMKNRLARGHIFRLTQFHYQSQCKCHASKLPLDVLVRLAQFYHTSTDYLLGLTDEKRPYPPSRRKF